MVDGGLEGGHIEWNGLGEVTPTEMGCRLDQRGVCLDVSSPSGWQIVYGESDRSADWLRVLQGDAYPYADFPIKKVVYRMPDAAQGGHHCLATLLAARADEAPAHRITEPEPGRFRVEGGIGGFPEAEMEDGDLKVRASGDSLEVSLSREPPTPGELETWSDRD